MRKETERWKSRWKIQDLLADGRCSQAVLDFLSTTDVGRLVPPEYEGDAGSKVSEWKLRERQEREEERGAEAAVLGAGEELGGEEQPLFLPTPLHGIGRRVGGCCASSCLFICRLSLVRITSSWDRPGRRANRGACNEPPSADCGREPDCTYPRHDLPRSHASNE